MAREATANTGGPLINNPTPRRSAGGIVARLEANAPRMAWHAACCASVSEPAARTCTMSSARAPSRELHTPRVVCGPRSGPRAARIVSISPVGSRVNSGLIRAPSGEASRSSESVIAVRSPSTVKRCAVTVSLSR